MLHRARKGTCETIENNRKSLNTKSTLSLSTITTIKSQTNPSEIARSWGKPVWHTEYALKFLEKVYSYIKERYIDQNNSSIIKSTSLSSSLRHKSRNAQIFKGNFIKIESSQKNNYYRPYYKIFNSKWPVLNLKPNKKGGLFPLSAADENYFYDSETKTISKQKTTIVVGATTAATVTKSLKSLNNNKNLKKSSTTSNIKMTRKNRSSSKQQQQQSRSKTSICAATTVDITNPTTATTTTTTKTTNSNNKQNLSSEKQCGFCEICRVEYDALTIHLKSESHQSFVKNEHNFLALDSLIKSSANMDKFLSLNSKTTAMQLENSTIAVAEVTATNLNNHASPTKHHQLQLRTSKRISNNGSPLKTTLSLPSTPPPLISSSLLSPTKQTASSVSFSLQKDHHHHHDQHQIEILEKTTTLGHTRQTRQQSSFANQQLQQQQQQQNLVQQQQLLTNNQQKQEDLQQEYENNNSIITVRAKRQSVKKINYAEPKEDEENVDDLILGYHRHQRKKKPKIKEKDIKAEAKTTTTTTNSISTTETVTTIAMATTATSITTQPATTTTIAKSKAKERRSSSQSELKQLPLPTSLLYKVVETNTSNSSNKKVTKKNSKKDYDNISVTKNQNSSTKTNRYANETKNDQKQIEKYDKQPSPIIVKIRKVRQSELSILSGEAVNFMFPKRRTSSSEPTDADRQTTSESGGDRTSSSIYASSSFIDTPKLPESEDQLKLTVRKTTLKRKVSSSNLGSSEIETTVNNIRKKRKLEIDNDNQGEEMTIKKERNTTDVILLGNTASTITAAEDVEDYGFDLRSSPRLSLHRNPPLRTYGRRKATTNNRKKSDDNTKEKSGGTTIKQKMPKSPSLDDIINEKLIKYKFAFERVPQHELWYQVFHRQDEGSEKSFEYYGSTSKYFKIFIPLVFS